MDCVAECDCVAKRCLRKGCRFGMLCVHLDLHSYAQVRPSQRRLPSRDVG